MTKKKGAEVGDVSDPPAEELELGEEPGTDPVDPQQAPPEPAPSRARARPSGPERPASGGGIDVREIQSGDNSLEARLRRILNRIALKPEVREFIIEYWTTTPAIQNPYALFDFLSKVQGVGGAQVAHIIRDYVYGGPPLGYNAPGGYAPQGGYPQPGYVPQGQGPWPSPYASPAERPETARDDTVDDMMSVMKQAIKIRAIASAMAPALGGGGGNGGGTPMIEMRPKMGPDGKFVFTAAGVPEYEYIPHTVPANDAVAMMQRYDRGDHLDPTKMMETMVSMFQTGVQTASQMGGGGADPNQLMNMQHQIHQANLETLKAQFAGTERLFNAERENLARQMDQLSPEKQAEQAKRLEQLGLGGNKDLETFKLQMRYNMWQTERGEAKELALAEQQRKSQDAAAARSQFHELVELGKSAIGDALKPVTVAIGDGLRERFARPSPGPAPVAGATSSQPPEKVFDPQASTSEQRQQYLQNLELVQQKLDREKARVIAADNPTESPPS